MRFATLFSLCTGHWFLVLLSIALAWVSAPWSLAQGLPGFTPEIQEAIQQAQRTALNDAFVGESVPLEGAIDASEYLVGPGDVFRVSIGTALPTDFAATVSADGLLVVPSVGSFAVAGESLTEARRAVLDGIRRSFRNVNAEVALERPRRFYVHVAGAVPQPGRHAVVPVARVEDALAAAMGDTSPILIIQEMRRAALLMEQPSFLPALRSVQVRHRDGTTETVDLWRYYTSGDLRFNPYVRDGDAIHVPAFRDDLTAVSVEGEVANAGTYDYRPGDTVQDLLMISAGATGFETLGEVRLVRRDSGDILTLDPAALDAGHNPLLQPGDRLLVTPQDLSAGVASVVGYVAYPGSYPIRNGETTLRDLVEMAGGLRPNALVRGAYLERRGITRTATYDPDQPTPYRPLPLDTNVQPQAVEMAIEAEIDALSGTSDLGFSGQQFYGRELLQPQRVSVDISAVLAGTAPAVLLQDGDRFVIPRDPNAVLVVGQVDRPGYVPFEPGLSAEDYIALAGGRGATASDVYVRSTPTGRLAPAGGEPLQSGDYVFVDRDGVGSTGRLQALVLQERSIKQQGRIQTYQVVLSGLSAVAAFITTYIAVTQ